MQKEYLKAKQKKINKQFENFIKNEYKTYEEAEQGYYDAIKNGEIHIEGTEPVGVPVSGKEISEGAVKKVATEDAKTMFDRLDEIAKEFEKGNVTSALRKERSRIFDENPKIKEVNDNFKKITSQLEGTEEFKKSDGCP